MPTYNYECDKCGTSREEVHSIKEDPIFTCSCGNTMKRGFIKNISGFILKGSGWSGKEAKEKSFRLKKRREVGRKMVKNHNIPQILPNYKGEVCESWSQAKSLAKTHGENTSNYDKKVDTLKKQQHEIKEKVSKLARGEEA